MCYNVESDGKSIAGLLLTAVGNLCVFCLLNHLGILHVPPDLSMIHTQ